jgi:ribosomal protein S18 acetylase RimI-like enzyme
MNQPFVKEMTKIRSLVEKDRARLLSMLIKTRAFTSEEMDVAMELIDIVLKDQTHKDYQIHCLVDDQDQAIGYICYGPAPMTQGTFDLYWIAVEPDFQEQGIGSKLLSFLEEVVRVKGGRMILADTSTLPQYEKTQKFYLRNGFQEVARIPDYYHPGNDRVTFCKKLEDRG